MVSVGVWDVQSELPTERLKNRKRMGSIAFDGARRMVSTGRAALRDIEIDRGNTGCVRASDPV